MPDRPSRSPVVIAFLAGVIAIFAVVAVAVITRPHTPAPPPARVAAESPSPESTTRASSGESEFVKRDGTQFTLGGKPFRFVGVNMYDAAGSPGGPKQCGPVYTDDGLDSSFKALHESAGAGVVRFWAFQSYTNGGSDWSQIDRVLRAARKYGLKVIPTLENEWQDCTTPDYKKPDSWFRSGYKSPYGAYTRSYADYAAVIAEHYKDDPTIMAWMLFNEAEGDNGALVSFARDVSRRIKAIDHNHLVTVGTLGNDAQKGVADARQYANLYGLPDIDFAVAGDYHRAADPLPGGGAGAPAPDPGSCRTTIACDMAVTRKRLHKPFVIDQSGIQSSDDAAKQLRAAQFDAKIAAQWRSGGAGYLVWMWSSDETDSGAADDFTIGKDDPAVAVLKRYASPLDR